MVNEKTQKNSKIQSYKYCCEKCYFYSNNKNDLKRHLQTKKHMLIDVKPKNFICVCGKQYKQSAGLSRHKHICNYQNNKTISNKWIKMDKKWIKMDKSEKCPFSYICECGKSYKYQSGLSKHKKNCKIVNTINETKKQEQSIVQYNEYNQNETTELTNMIMKVLEKNTEILEEVKEIAKEPKTIHNTTNNNQQFNVMNYLNTECKDAMNLSDFIKEFVFSLDDLNLLYEKGYQEAMEQTFIKQLQDMDKTKRPIHCSDKKRKSFYVKDKDIWIKDENNLKILDGVKEITHKQFGAIKQWATYNKDWLDVEKKQDFFNMSVCELSKAKKEKYLNKLIIKLTGLSLK
jgi:hypothetical protein